MGLSVQFYELILALAALVGAVGVVVGSIMRIIKPIREQLSLIDELNERSKRDYAARIDMQTALDHIIHSEIALCRSLEGHPEFNSKQEIGEAYAALTHYLIERQRVPVIKD
jgi:hypothetical protein